MTGQTVVIDFEGEHRPTGARVALRVIWDGKGGHCDDNRCPLCGCDVGLVVHAHMTMCRRSVKTAAQCTTCHSWFEEIGIPGHESHRPLTLTFE